MLQALRLEEWQVVNIANVDVVPLIKVRAGTVGIRVIRIDQPGIVTRGGVVNGVAIGVGNAQFESTDVVPQGGFQRVVVGGGSLILAPNAGKTKARTIEVWVAATSNGQIIGPASRHGNWVASIHVGGSRGLAVSTD